MARINSVARTLVRWGRVAPWLGLLLANACRTAPGEEHVRPLASADDVPFAGRSEGAGGTRAGGNATGGGGVGEGRDGGGTPRGGGNASADGGAGDPRAGAGGDEPAGGTTASGTDGSSIAGTSAQPAFTLRGLLETTGTCARLHYEDFARRARELADATAAFAADRSDAKRDAARAAFLAAFASWQRAEAFRFGPASSDAMTGGMSLRDQIYAYPLINRCAIDGNLVSQAYGSGVGALSANQRGLGALEYLLFHTGPENDCASASAINQNGSWAALDDTELALRRVAYARAAADDMVARARTLVDAWDPDEGDFYQTLITAGDGSAVFADAQDAFNAINEALYYVEIEIKDIKVGGPLGVETPCGTGCARLVEARFSRASQDAVRQNLIGARRLFQGCGAGYTGLGFDDWLGEVGADELATRMIDALGDAQAAVDAVSPSFEDALVASPAQLQAVYAAVKAFTDLLKADFISTLNLEPPMSAQGDTD